MIFRRILRNRLQRSLYYIPQYKVININEYFNEYIENKKNEWRNKGYSSKAIDGAIKMAIKYVYRMSKEIAPDNIEMQNRIIISWFPTALTRYGVRFIKGMKDAYVKSD